MAPGALQTAPVRGAERRIEAWLEAERDQLPLWVPVALGLGIAWWFVLPGPRAWTAAALAGLALAAGGLATARGGRLAAVAAAAGLLVAGGVALAWTRAERVRAPVLARPAVVRLDARVERVEPLPARDLVRLRLAPIRVVPEGGRTAPAPTLPPRVRVNLATADLPAGLAVGATVRLGARLMPPPPPVVPGAYDFARVAWFDGLGATGRGYAPVELLGPPLAGGETLRARLSRHIQARLPGSAGGIADALATGNTGAIADADAEAMRRAGLSHLLSVSGLHITAAVAATMVVVLRLLALVPGLALRVRLPLVAGVAGAAAAIGYTWLTGAQVPTVRSCVAALLVLAALALGREAVTLRLVAAGAFAVLLVRPEALAGPSFQLSFAAVTAIVALHEHPRVRGWFAPGDGDGWARRAGRGVASLLLTGLAVELALLPIAAFHFHKAGLYGAAANLLAIPLTTFVVMPAEALALLLDAVGLGTPAWWVVGRALAGLLGLAHAVAAAPGAVAALPAMPTGAFALCVGGGLWLALWRTGLRAWGAVPLAIGVGWALLTPAPDLLVTGDGRHVGVRDPGGRVLLLRERTGDYARDLLATGLGAQGEPLAIDGRPDARCSRDLCLVEIARGGRHWRVLATRSADLLPVPALAAACRGADIVVSERRLPRGCRPRWLRLDAPVLRRTGGVAVTLSRGTVATVRTPGDRHPWRAEPPLRTGLRPRRPPRMAPP
jgi:competence protein ComEC